MSNRCNVRDQYANLNKRGINPQAKKIPWNNMQENAELCIHIYDQVELSTYLWLVSIFLFQYGIYVQIWLSTAADI